MVINIVDLEKICFLTTYILYLKLRESYILKKTLIVFEIMIVSRVEQITRYIV